MEILLIILLPFLISIDIVPIVAHGHPCGLFEIYFNFVDSIVVSIYDNIISDLNLHRTQEKKFTDLL